MKNLILLSMFLFLIACTNTKQESGKAQQEPVQTPNQEQPDAVSTPQAQPVEVATQPSTSQNQAEVMLNPPHGQPYHRCDIAVGAPLDSPPSNATPQSTNTKAPVAAPGKANTPNMQAIENAMKATPSPTKNAAAANTGTKPLLNPAHGQPFHRCDIPVGSPLP